jgi:signal transduction histidine kinase/ActR/RegA family two-component response regulator
MSIPPPDNRSEESIVILAPSGRDAELATGVFAREGWTSQTCPNLPSLLAALHADRGAVLLAEEALDSSTIAPLREFLAKQPHWSDIPVVLLTSTSSTRVRSPLELFQGDGNVTLLERPLQVVTLVSTMRAALRARRRQYQVRSLLLEREQARQEALHANRTKDHFLAALSHELRTPLTPVLMTVAALKQDPALPPELKEDLSCIHRNVELEARLIDDLLDLTRITRGKLILHQQVMNLHHLVRQTVEMCCGPEAPKHLQIDVQLDATKPFVHCDPARIQQVLWNLINNAIKFTPAHGRISLRTFDGEDHTFHLSVTDSGIGISPEVLPRLFDAFEQADTSITRRFGGLGLGLAITKAIVDLHEGSLRVTSEGPGRGATFHLCMQKVAPPAQPMDPARTPELGALPPSRILLVEDHEATRLILTRLLKRAGHEVQSAASVAAALELGSRYDFEILVSDVGLPDGTGMDLCRKLKLDHAFFGIALSGYGMDEDLKATASAGFHAHLVKPVDWPRLEAALREVQSLQRSEAHALVSH